MSLYLAVDLGTTGCRSIIFDSNLDCISSDYEEYGLITPKENWVEQDANLWWELTLKTAKNAINKGNVNPKDIDAISVSSQGITIVPVDKDFSPLCNAISWLDTRAETETEQIAKDFGPDYIFKLSGRTLSADYTLPKLLWFKNNQPEIFGSAYKFLMPLDFLIAKFTGRAVTDYSMATGTMLYDLKKLCWSQEILNFYGIDENTLPEVAPSYEKAGYVLPEVAEKLGLKENCVVAVGAQDQKCAAYGVGLEEGVMTISLGTAAAISKLWKTAENDADEGICWCGYVEKDSYTTEGVIGTAGTCLRWTRDMLFKGEKFDVIDNEAIAARERGSSLLFYPYLAGPGAPDNYPESEGVFYGVNLATTRGDFALAVMEGVAFQMRVILESMKAYGNVKSIILFGGGAKSDLWADIIANATGMELQIPKTFEAAGAGAARLAARATGVELPPLKVTKTIIPKQTEEYYQKYLKYRKFEKKMWS